MSLGDTHHTHAELAEKVARQQAEQSDVRRVIGAGTLRGDDDSDDDGLGCFRGVLWGLVLSAVAVAAAWGILSWLA